MKKNAVLKEGQIVTVIPDEMLKVTTLIYLKDALLKEEYEECSELIEKARYSGAKSREIRKVLDEYARKVRGRHSNVVNKRSEGRLRF